MEAIFKAGYNDCRVLDGCGEYSKKHFIPGWVSLAVAIQVRILGL
jgi:hypothetical protein